MQPIYISEYPARSLGSRITALSAFAKERGFHAAGLAETLADSMIEWSLD